MNGGTIASIVLAVVGVVVLILVLVYIFMQIDKLKEITAPVVVDQVDLVKYLGNWHEIARLPSWFENSCLKSTATYTLKSTTPVPTITVLNQCATTGGGSKSAEGTAVPAPGTTVSQPSADSIIVSPAKLSVSFFPLVSGPYWILALASDYSWSMVGSPDRSYLWILSRTPTLDPVILSQLVEQARQLNYPVQKLVINNN